MKFSGSLILALLMGLGTVALVAASVDSAALASCDPPPDPQKKK